MSVEDNKIISLLEEVKANTRNIASDGIEYVKTASDYVITYTYSDAGTADERVATIVHSSTSLNVSYTQTITYAGSSGSYRVDNITTAITP